MPLFPSYPPCASRLHDLLARAELSHDAVAQCIGLNADWVRDLQAFDHELYSNVSLAQLQRLAYLLNTDASTLLLAPPLPQDVVHLTFEQLVQKVREHLRSSNTGIEAFGESVGWDVSSALSNPHACWEWCPDEVVDVAGALGIPWQSVLPPQALVPPPVPHGV
ncbi:MAG: hypothetical protein IPJ57_14925 [Gemmatimonadetes bacterium]|nr:hypothetical protein [Gemmatimonadota bacterium]MBK7785774.1 hypothetical protein [Gemmatimonadota bacterium]MBK9067105.1 hypothetical protein [Gemmatimonadota bacterium]